MKKAWLSYLALLFFIAAGAQKIQYCRETFSMPYADGMQLVANVGSYHHLVCFNLNKNPVIYRYDAQLQFHGKQEMDFKLKEASDVRIIPFKDYYLLYSHLLNTSAHELFKIDGKGNVTALSAAFQKVINSELNKTLSTVQLVNQGEKLYVVAHTYYDGIKKIASNVIELDNELNPVLGRKVLYNFKREEDVLQQVMLVGNSLLVLKSSRNDEKGASLDMIKVDLTTGMSLINSFNSGSHLYSSPSFTYQPKDSSVIIYSIIREPITNTRSQRTVFISHLDAQLHEMTPVGLLRSQFRQNTAVNYLLLQGCSNWIAMRANLRINRYPRTPASQNFEMESDASTLSLSRQLRNPSLSSSSYFSDYNQPAAVRFTLLDGQLKTKTDSLVANDEKVFDVQPFPFAQFSILNKPYLLLVQNFSSGSRGILMATTNGRGNLTTTDIPVFDKYNYLLDQLQVAENKYVILPYSHKSDIGLVKISFD